MAYVLLFARLVLGGVFVLSALSKFSPSQADAFAVGIIRLAGIPPKASRVLSRLTLAAELTTATLLAVPATSLTGLACAATLLLVFLVVLVRAVRAGVDESCHCFGASADPVTFRHVVRTGLLLCLALVAVGVSSQSPATSVPAAGIALTALVAAVTVGAAVLLDDLASLLDPPSRPTTASPLHS